jgi:tetratricopeptide (TPR) repeat protein
MSTWLATALLLCTTASVQSEPSSSPSGGGWCSAHGNWTVSVTCPGCSSRGPSGTERGDGGPSVNPNRGLSIQLRDRGVELLKAGRYREALAKFDESLKYVQSTQRYHGAAICSFQLKSYADAVKYLNGALDIDPNLVEPLHLLGCSYFELRQYDRAIEAFSREIRVDSSRPKAQYCLGMSYYVSATSGGADRDSRARRLSSAAQAFRGSSALEPDNAEAVRMLGVSLFDCGKAWSEQGKSDAAIEAFRDAIRVRPGGFDGQAHARMGNLLLQKNNPEPAARALEQALRLKAADVDARRALAESYLRLGRKDDAIGELGEALAHRPGDAGLLLKHGAACRERGRLDEAVGSLEQAARAVPADAAVRAELTRAYDDRIASLRAEMAGYERELQKIKSGLTASSTALEEWASLSTDARDKAQKKAAELAIDMILDKLAENSEFALAVKRTRDADAALQDLDALAQMAPAIAEEVAKLKVLPAAQQMKELRRLKDAAMAGATPELAEDVIGKLNDYAGKMSDHPHVKLFTTGLSAGLMNLSAFYAHAAGRESKERLEQFCTLSEKQFQIATRTTEKYVRMADQLQELKRKRTELERK